VSGRLRLQNDKNPRITRASSWLKPSRTLLIEAGDGGWISVVDIGASKHIGPFFGTQPYLISLIIDSSARHAITRENGRQPRDGSPESGQIATRYSSIGKNSRCGIFGSGRVRPSGRAGMGRSERLRASESANGAAACYSNRLRAQSGAPGYY